MDPLDYLFSLEFHGIKLGLDNITDLLHRLDTPQDSYPTIHVGGTNGKGSTIAFLDHIFRASGYRVGRFTSPHLCTLNERFMVNGELISDENLREITNKVAFHAKQFDSPPTFFEVNTAIAFEYFKHQDIDLALIEVGMGGRFDSTNVITPVASVITNIALEHTQYLGDTVEKIAFEKAGIIKANVPVFLGNIESKAREAIIAQAQSLQAPVTQIDRDIQFNYTPESNTLAYSGATWILPSTPLPLPGTHQSENAALALSTAEGLSSAFPKLNSDSALQGIQQACWPCRMESVLTSPHAIVDVAHNPAGAQTLVNTLDTDAIFILSVSTDKDTAAMLKTLSTRAMHIIATQFDGHRATPASQLLDQIPETTPMSLCSDFNQAIDQGIQLALKTNCPLVITGSIFTAGQARTYLMESYNAPPLKF